MSEQDSARTTARRRVRWTLAFVIIVAAVALYGYWLATGRRPACQVTTINHTGALTGSDGTEITRVCGLPGPPVYLPILAVVGMLLLPDLKSLSIGGLQFERLTTQVDQVAKDIGALSQTVTTTVNVGASFLKDAKAEFVDQKAALDILRIFLLDDPGVTVRLKMLDDFALTLDRAPLGAMIRAIATAQDLIEQAREVAAAELLRRCSADQSASSAADTVSVDEVIGEILKPIDLDRPGPAHPSDG